MARINSSLRVKLDTYMDNVVQAAYDELNDLEACAGIRNNEDLATKARKNHYGFITPRGVPVPARVWVNAATKDLDAGQALADIIKSRLIPARARQVKTEKIMDFQLTRGRTQEVYTQREISTKPFGGNTGGPYNIMKAIADKMADNQRNFIRSWGVTPPNAPSTIKRKGGNKPPLVWTGAMVKGIKGWVQYTSKRVESEVNQRNSGGGE